MTKVLPEWAYVVSGWSSIIASLVIFSCTILHFKNYRKPFEQRLMIRIQLIVPLFALSCYAMLIDSESVFNKFVLEPTREIYEAFVIYTFFLLLTQMLGGERNIIIVTSGREPVSHPGILKYMLPAMDISDPYTFLNVKRGILQYVWLKPIICFSILFTEALGFYNGNDLSISSINLWLTIIYNFSVSLSLYCLAIFWKILWNDLKPFDPLGKFLCVKLIIFASYWQGVVLTIVNFAGLLPEKKEGDLRLSIQNALLCFELIFFSIGHWYSFSYKPFTIQNIPNGRLRFWNAVKDPLGINDLIHDFQLTFYGDYYKDYQQFDSVEALIAHPESRGRMSRINQGMRYHSDGTQKHWLYDAPKKGSIAKIQSTSESQAMGVGASAPSIRSIGTTGTSVRAIYEESIRSSVDSIVSSLNTTTPTTTHTNTQLFPFSITESLNQDSVVNYNNELLDDDEFLYSQATSEINNFNLYQEKVQKMLNYPIVDEVVGGHLFGHKVKKLRAERQLLLSSTYGAADEL